MDRKGRVGSWSLLFQGGQTQPSQEEKSAQPEGQGCARCPHLSPSEIRAQLTPGQLPDISGLPEGSAQRNKAKNPVFHKSLRGLFVLG